MGLKLSYDASEWVAGGSWAKLEIISGQFMPYILIVGNFLDLVVSHCNKKLFTLGYKFN